MGARRESGISLVELMVVVLVVGILIAAAVPSFTTWIQNTQIRTAAEGLMNGLQTAKNEAIRRNSCIQMEITGRTAWRVNPCSDPAADPPVAQRAAEEGSVNADIVRLPAASTIVSFNAFGRIVDPNPSDGTPALTQIEVCNPTMTGPQAAEMRQLRIQIPPGGAVRMCDPSPTVLAGDPRACAAAIPVACP